MDPTGDPVIVRRIRDVLFVTLHRPATRNALAPDVVAGLVGERVAGERALALGLVDECADDVRAGCAAA